MDGQRLLELHRLAIERHGGENGLLDADGVGGAYDQARTKAGYTSDAPDDPLHVAVHLLFVIARNHYFQDGNKRVAWLAMEDHLRSVGLRVVITTDEAEALVLSIAAGGAIERTTFESVVGTVARHLVAFL